MKLYERCYYELKRINVNKVNDTVFEIYFCTVALDESQVNFYF